LSGGGARKTLIKDNRLPPILRPVNVDLCHRSFRISRSAAEIA
jgi:hypothetical protein